MPMNVPKPLYPLVLGLQGPDSIYDIVDAPRARQGFGAAPGA